MVTRLRPRLIFCVRAFAVGVVVVAGVVAGTSSLAVAQTYDGPDLSEFQAEFTALKIKLDDLKIATDYTTTAVYNVHTNITSDGALTRAKLDTVKSAVDSAKSAVNSTRNEVIKIRQENKARLNLIYTDAEDIRVAILATNTNLGKLGDLIEFVIVLLFIVAAIQVSGPILNMLRGRSDRTGGEV